MNAGLFAISLLTGGNTKKQIGLVLATMAIILSLPFMAVTAMGSSVLTFLSSVPNAEAAELQGFYMGGPVPGNTYEWGNCTYWSFAQRLWANNPIPTTWGNANTWDDYAKRDGYEVNNTPLPGSIFQTDSGNWGHVAFVTKVEPDGTWTISEMNVKGLNIVNTRTFPKDAAIFYSFIHNKVR